MTKEEHHILVKKLFNEGGAMLPTIDILDGLCDSFHKAQTLLGYSVSIEIAELMLRDALLIKGKPNYTRAINARNN